MRNEGAALVAALWFVSAVAALSVAFIGLTRNDRAMLVSQAEAVQARALTDAGLARAAATLSQLQGRQRARPFYRWQLDEGTITATITSESAKIDLNAADESMISALAQAVEVPPELATRIADAVIDWRDENKARQGNGAEDRDYDQADRPYEAADRPFASVAELRYLLPVEPRIYARLAPFLTVYTGQAEPERRLASPTVRKALAIRRGLAPTKSDDKEDGTPETPGRGGLGGGAESMAAPSSLPPGSPTPGGPSRPPSSATASGEGQGQSVGDGDPQQIYSVLLDVGLPGGYEAHARAVIWLAGGQSGPPVRVLDWTPALIATAEGP